MESGYLLSMDLQHSPSIVSRALLVLVNLRNSLEASHWRQEKKLLKDTMARKKLSTRTGSWWRCWPNPIWQVDELESNHFVLSCSEWLFWNRLSQKREKKKQSKRRSALHHWLSLLPQWGRNDKIKCSHFLCSHQKLTTKVCHSSQSIKWIIK